MWLTLVAEEGKLTKLTVGKYFPCCVLYHAVTEVLKTENLTLQIEKPGLYQHLKLLILSWNYIFVVEKNVSSMTRGKQCYCLRIYAGCNSGKLLQQISVFLWIWSPSLKSKFDASENVDQVYCMFTLKSWGNYGHISQNIVMLILRQSRLWRDRSIWQKVTVRSVRCSMSILNATTLFNFFSP